MKKTAFLCLFLAGGLLMAGCQGKPELANQTFVFELGDDVYGNPSLYLQNPSDWNTKNMSILPVSPGISTKDNRFVTVSQDYLGVGEYDFDLISGSHTVPFVIKIKDTRPPVVMQDPGSVTLTYGQTVDWQSLYQAADLSGVYYDAPQDLVWQTGERDVTVRIYDRFGNSTTKNLHVSVTG